MWIALTTTLLLAAASDVSLTTLAGDQATGQLVRLDSDGAALKTAAGERSWEARDLLSLKPATAPQSQAAKAATVWIELIDGSELLATEYLVTKGLAKVTLLGGESVDIPTRSLHAVRLKEHSSDLARSSQLPRQWREIVEAQPAGDVIIIRKLSATEDDADKEGPMTAALDQLEGVLGDVTGDKVHFTFDGQAIPVDRAKVEGVVYFHPAGRELPDPLCRILDVAGSRWNAKSLTLAGDTVQFVTTSGVKGELPLARVEGLDYSAGKIVFLSDVEPEIAEWTGVFGPNAAEAKLAKLFAPRRDRDFHGEPLVLHGQSYQKGLAIHSRTELRYRLDGKYSKFLALAGIDDRVRPAGDLVLTISLDGNPLGEHRIRGKDDAAKALEYDVRGGRKLTIVVDYGAGLDVADRLHLVNARVTK